MLRKVEFELMNTTTTQQTSPPSSLRLELLEQTQRLSTASLGLVAALAWNDAVQSLMRELFGTQSGLVAKFAYALLITVLVVIVTFRLSRLIARLKKTLHEDSP